MKRISYPFMIFTTLIYFCFITCDKKEEEKSETFKLLTAHPWQSDSLLADGVEAGEPGQLLYSFAGVTEFNEDGTGNVGIYEGVWTLSKDEKILTINSDSLPAVATAIINELNDTSLKISTIYPSQQQPSHLINVRMTFIPY